jgi:lysophosphatidate acyltransferase
MMLSGAVFIDRGNNEKAIRSLKVATDLMKRLKFSLWVFPEGTRHLGPETDLLPFKKGGFHMAAQAGIPIIPVVAENYWHIYRQGFLGTGVIKVRGMYLSFTTETFINSVSLMGRLTCFLPLFP